MIRTAALAATALAVALAACGDQRAARPVDRDGGRSVTHHDAGLLIDAAAASAPPDRGHAPDAAVAAATLPADCDGVPATATVAALPTHDGVAGFIARTRDDQRWLVFDRKDECLVLPIGRAQSRLNAALWPGRPEVKAFALRAECEDEDTCPAAVAVRDEAGTVLDAIAVCDASEAITLHVASVFADRPSLLVACTSLTGYGLDEELILLHVIDDALREVLRVDGAWGDHGEGDCTDCRQRCWNLLSAARWRRLGSGPTPELETTSPQPYPHLATPAQLRAPNLRRWRFDPTTQRFVVISSRRVAVAIRDDACTSLPLPSPLR